MRYEEEFFREKFSEIFATVTKGCDEQEPFFSFSFFFPRDGRKFLNWFGTNLGS